MKDYQTGSALTGENIADRNSTGIKRLDVLKVVRNLSVDISQISA